jgi:hypothetical protein
MSSMQKNIQNDGQIGGTSKNGASAQFCCKNIANQEDINNFTKSVTKISQCYLNNSSFFRENIQNAQML